MYYHAIIPSDRPVGRLIGGIILANLIHDKEEKKKNIILAALKAYSDFGINNATSRQIAEIASIGKSTIFEYFKNMDELKQEVFQYLFKTNLESKNLIKNLVSENPVKALQMLIDNNIDITLNHPEFLLLITQYTFDIFIKSNRFEESTNEYTKKVNSNNTDIEDEINMIVINGVNMGIFKPLTETPERAVFIVRALLREIQTQAFVKDKEELIRVCNVLKDTIYEILGVTER